MINGTKSLVKDKNLFFDLLMHISINEIFKKIPKKHIQTKYTYFMQK